MARCGRQRRSLDDAVERAARVPYALRYDVSHAIEKFELKVLLKVVKRLLFMTRRLSGPVSSNATQCIVTSSDDLDLD